MAKGSFFKSTSKSRKPRAAAAGGGGGAGNDGTSARGGFGSRAIFEVPVSHPQSFAFSVGSVGGAAGNQNVNDCNDSSFGVPALVTCEAGDRGFVPGIPGTNNPGNDPSFANSGITEIASVGSGNKDNNATIQLSNNGLMGGFSGSGRASGGNIAGEQGQLIIFQNIGS